MITITLSVPVVHGISPFFAVLETIHLLKETIEASTPETPALGGPLKDNHGFVVGSYQIEFGEKARSKPG